MRNNNSIKFVTATTATIAIAACCLLIFSPQVRAFIPSPRSVKSPSHRERNIKSTSSDCDDDSTNKRQPDGMPILPSNVVQYTQVPKVGTAFTAQKIPSGLLKQHTTKKGTWGVIRVSQGQLEYTIHEPQPSVHVLDKDHLGVIEPTMLHQVKALSEDMEFVVEFWRAPGTGGVDEKREGL